MRGALHQVGEPAVWPALLLGEKHVPSRTELVSRPRLIVGAPCSTLPGPCHSTAVNGLAVAVGVSHPTQRSFGARHQGGAFGSGPVAVRGEHAFQRRRPPGGLAQWPWRPMEQTTPGPAGSHAGMYRAHRTLHPCLAAPQAVAQQTCAAPLYTALPSSPFLVTVKVFRGPSNNGPHRGAQA